jgi:hypothetical protein
MELDRRPFQGKTFTLFGSSENTSGYYAIIEDLVDEALELEPDINLLLYAIQTASRRKRYLRNIINKKLNKRLIEKLLNRITPELEQFTENTEDHLRSLSLWKTISDKRLATTREQYHLYMLEIALTNRQYSQKFLQCDRKTALLPHCLRDLQVDCKKAINGFDFQCRRCSLKCYQNALTTILAENGIEPYIWMGASYKNLVKETLQSGKSFGMLGIACIPELVTGMRKCRKYRIPVVGLPLNANRCIRWFGEFRPNSVDLVQLEKLLLSKKDSHRMAAFGPKR